MRLFAALIARSREDIRRFGSLYLSGRARGSLREGTSWVVAQALGDTAGFGPDLLADSANGLSHLPRSPSFH